MGEKRELDGWKMDEYFCVHVHRYRSVFLRFRAAKYCPRNARSDGIIHDYSVRVKFVKEDTYITSINHSRKLDLGSILWCELSVV